MSTDFAPYAYPVLKDEQLSAVGERARIAGHSAGFAAGRREAAEILARERAALQQEHERALERERQLGGVRLLKDQTVKEMERNQTGNVKVRQQPTAEPLRSKPYPIGAGEDVWGLGFQIAAPGKPAADMRRPGSLTWAGINNTFFWIDPEKQIGAIVLMQVLPFYDDAAIGILQGTEKLIYQNVH